ncbi:hypothetical protein I317_02495 [Kwoniella heveanensis CBS 569]|nr:hypothetical protein I317_02495 [Kwoniella heveanensis CBS 569]
MSGSSTSLANGHSTDNVVVNLSSARQKGSTSMAISLSSAPVKAASSLGEKRPRPSTTPNQVQIASSPFSRPAVAGPSSRPISSTQIPSSLRAGRHSPSSQKPKHRQSTLPLPFVRLGPEVDDPSVHDAKGKGKRRAFAEPIDLTLSDTDDDEQAPTLSTLPKSEMLSGSSRLSEYSSSGDIVPLNTDLRPIVFVNNKPKNKLKNRDMNRSRLLGRTASISKKGQGGVINSKEDWQRIRQPHLSSSQSGTIPKLKSTLSSQLLQTPQRIQPNPATSSSSRPATPSQAVPSSLMKPRIPTQGMISRAVSPKKPPSVIKTPGSQRSSSVADSHAYREPPPNYNLPNTIEVDNSALPHSRSTSVARSALASVSRLGAVVSRPQPPAAIKLERMQTTPAGSPTRRLVPSTSKRRLNSKEWEEALKQRKAQENALQQNQTVVPGPSNGPSPSPAPTQNSRPVKTVFGPESSVGMERIRSGSSLASESRLRTALSSGPPPIGFGGMGGPGGDTRMKPESPLKKSVPLPSTPGHDSDDDSVIVVDIPPLVKASPSPVRKTTTSASIPKAPPKIRSSPVTDPRRPTARQHSTTQTNAASIVNKRISRMAEEDEESYRPKSSQSHARTKRNSLPFPQMATSTARDRPTRVRPEKGAYTLPTPETSIYDWPLLESTHAAGGSKKRSSLAGQDRGKGKESSVQAGKIGASNQSKLNVARAIKERSSAKKSSQTPNAVSALLLQRSMSGSTASTLTPPPSPTLSQDPKFARSDAQRRTVAQQQKRIVNGHNVSPTKSLSATPAKGRFPQLLPDVENTHRTKRQAVSNAADDVDEEDEEEEVEEKEEIEKEVEKEDLEPNVDDILAEFEGYEWAESDGEGDASEGNEEDATSPITAQNEAEGTFSGEAALPDSNHSHRQHAVALPGDTTTLDPSTPAKQILSQSDVDASKTQTPRSSPKRLRPSSLSLSPTHTKRHLSSDHWDKLLREEEAIRDQEREEAKKKEKAMQLDLDRIADVHDDDEAGQTDVGEDLNAFLHGITNAAPEKPAVLSAVASRAVSRQVQAEADRRAKQQARADAARAAERAERLRQVRKEDRTFTAVLNSIRQSDDIHEALMGISNGTNDHDVDLSNIEAEDAYPTPARSETSSGHDADETMDLPHVLGEDVAPENEVDFDKMVENARDEGMVIDADLVRDAKFAKTKPVEGLRWEGFWRKDFKSSDNNVEIIQPDCSLKGNEIWDLVVQAIDKQDLRMLSLIVGSPAFAYVGTNDVTRWLFTNALQAGHAVWAQIAQDACIHFLHALEEHPCTPWEDMESDLLHALTAMGAESSILRGHSRRQNDQMEWPNAIRNREATFAKSEQLFSAEGWIPILLTLTVDVRTPFALRKQLGETIHDLLVRALERDDHKTAKVLAQAIAQTTRDHGDDVRAAVLDALGQGTPQAREVHRWLGMEYLTRGTLEEVISMDNSPNVPTINHVVEAIKTIYGALKPNSGEPDFSDLNHRVTFLYAALSDFAALLEQHSIDVESGGAGDKGGKDLLAESELDQIRTWVRLCRDRIADKSDGTERSTVKARLHQLYEFSRLLLLVEIKKKIRSKRAGKGYKFGEGKGGQTKLDFGVK